MTNTTHFDRRAANYDADELHRRIVEILVGRAEIKPGFRVLDVATGTGAVALKVAKLAGPSGKVVGVDVSGGMLAEARRKAEAGSIQNVEFIQADAERIDSPREDYDCVFCASALVLLSNIRAALRRWFELLRPSGVVAFDTPAKPFGISQRAAEAAAKQNILLTYNEVADTPAKCRFLLREAGFHEVNVRTEIVSSSPIDLAKAVGFWDAHLDHPAWEPLRKAPHHARDAARSDYIRSLESSCMHGYVPNEIALNFVVGRKAHSE